MKKILELFYTFSEYFIAYIINAFFTLLLTLPLILIGLLLKVPVTKVILVFIPLCALYPLAVKNLIFSFYNLVYKNREYYGLYFIKSLKSNFFRNYTYCLVVTALLYVGIVSSLILVNTVSPFFFVLIALISIIIVPHAVFTTISFALYDGIDLKTILHNSLILSFMYAPLSLALTIMIGFLVITYKTHPFIVMALGLPLLSGVIVYLWMNISKNIKMNEGSIDG